MSAKNTKKFSKSRHESKSSVDHDLKDGGSRRASPKSKSPSNAKPGANLEKIVLQKPFEKEPSNAPEFLKAFSDDLSISHPTLGRFIEDNKFEVHLFPPRPSEEQIEEDPDSLDDYKENRKRVNKLKDDISRIYKPAAFAIILANMSKDSDELVRKMTGLKYTQRNVHWN